MTKELYQRIKDTVEEIKKADKDGFYAKCAIRKASAINEDSALETIIRTAEDLVLIAEKVS